MRRVLIIGNAGSGKSTFGRKLAEKTGLPLVHLDKLFWNGSWEHVSREEFDAALQRELEQETWIIDGNYGGTLDIRLDAADTIIFLDFSRLRCLYRVIKRGVKYRNKERPDMRKGNKERIDLAFYKWTWHFPRDQRPTIIAKLEKLPQVKEVIWLHTPKDVERFLNILKEKDEQK